MVVSNDESLLITDKVIKKNNCEVKRSSLSLVKDFVLACHNFLVMENSIDINENSLLNAVRCLSFSEGIC